MHEEKLMVIGDDVTGANDTGVMFADGGFSTDIPYQCGLAK